MKPEEIRKLIGGYATGTLTDQERRALFEAALTDQDLFDALAREQSLRDLLEDPDARRQLLNAVRPEPAASAPWWKRPLPWALAGSLATAALLVTVFVRQRVEAPKAEPVLIAKREEPAPAVREAPQPVHSRLEAPGHDREGAAEAKDAVAEMPEKAVSAAAEREEAPRQFSVGAVAMKSLANAAPAALPYRLFQADAEGNYTERPPQTVFPSDARIRVVFEPAVEHRLRVTTGSNQVLLDTDVASGSRPTVEVPAGERRLTVSFDSEPSFEILIRRE
ncbi:MAG: hypothetical protein ACE141_08715 [Bryobacteraceae bacterium]